MIELRMIEGDRLPRCASCNRPAGYRLTIGTKAEAMTHPICSGCLEMVERLAGKGDGVYFTPAEQAAITEASDDDGDGLGAPGW